MNKGCITVDKSACEARSSHVAQYSVQLRARVAPSKFVQVTQVELRVQLPALPEIVSPSYRRSNAVGFVVDHYSSPKRFDKTGDQIILAVPNAEDRTFCA